MKIFSRKTDESESIPEPVITESASSFSDGASAHRDVHYDPPSEIRQMTDVMRLQMSTFAKKPTTYIFIIFFVAVSAYMAGGSTPGAAVSNGLGIMPFVVVLVSILFCADSISSEFRNKTAYMNFALPVSRHVIYIGKFLAGLIMSFAAVFLIYGAVLLTVRFGHGFDVMNVKALAQSLFLSLTTVFALCSTAYFFGSFTRRGAGVMTIIAATAVGCAFLGARSVSEILMYLPFVSVINIPNIIAPFELSSFFGASAVAHGNLSLMIGCAVAWGIVMLFAGLIAFRRREVV